MLTIHPVTTSWPLSSVEKHLPCGDISHHQPLFFPTICHHPQKVLVADLEEGMGTLVHKGSRRNPAFGLWPLSQALVQTVKRALEGGEEVAESEREKEETQVRTRSQEDGQAMSLSAFLGEKNDDADWEVVDRPTVIQEKFVLVGKRDVGDVCVNPGLQPEWVQV